MKNLYYELHHLKYNCIFNYAIQNIKLVLGAIRNTVFIFWIKQSKIQYLYYKLYILKY